MTVKIDGRIYYRTLEACKKTGISRATLFRWLKEGLLEQQLKDRRGWRIFTEEDLDNIRSEAGKIEIEYTSPGGGCDQPRGLRDDRRTQQLTRSERGSGGA